MWMSKKLLQFRLGANSMKKYIVEISETVKRDLENIILYHRNNLAGENYQKIRTNLY